MTYKAKVMTDLEKFIELYKSIGIELEPVINNGKTIISISEGEDKKLTGYFGFYTSIEFDENGKFLEQGFYE